MSEIEQIGLLPQGFFGPLALGDIRYRPCEEYALRILACAARYRTLGCAIAAMPIMTFSTTVRFGNRRMFCRYNAIGIFLIPVTSRSQGPVVLDGRLRLRVRR
jgi:hypothetical protein